MLRGANCDAVAKNKAICRGRVSVEGYREGAGEEDGGSTHLRSFVCLGRPH